MNNIPVIDAIKITNIHTFFRRLCNKQYVFSGETHDFWEMLYVVRGSLCVSADERVYTLSEGQAIFHKPMEFHKFHINNDTDSEIFVISYDAVGVLCDFFKEKVFILNSYQKNIISDLIDYAERYSHNDLPEFKRYLPAFDTVTAYSQVVALHIHQLMLSLSESNKLLSISKNRDSVLFSAAVKYLNNHLCDNLSVSDIAAYLRVSESSLKRIFSKYTGIGVHKYFLKIKLKTAIEFLQDGYSVTEVSEKLGFSSQGYFTNVFKREFDKSPSTFKSKAF